MKRDSVIKVIKNNVKNKDFWLLSRLQNSFRLYLKFIFFPFRVFIFITYVYIIQRPWVSMVKRIGMGNSVRDFKEIEYEREDDIYEDPENIQEDL